MTDLLVVLAGCLAWTFIEYGMHHWNGHLLKGRTRFSKEHLIHHSKKDYFTPWGRKLVFSLLIAMGLWSVSVLFLGLQNGSCFGGGIFLGYLFYEYVHWASHMVAPKTAYGRWVRRNHFSHHFKDARFNHGVTSPLWDMVFGTYRAPGTIRVPRKLQMGWLMDPDTGGIRHEFRNDFEFKGAQQRT